MPEDAAVIEAKEKTIALIHAIQNVHKVIKRLSVRDLQEYIEIIARLQEILPKVPKLEIKDDCDLFPVTVYTE